eukprot:1502729-Pleurochrysis_carterae.AAC.3
MKNCSKSQFTSCSVLRKAARRVPWRMGGQRLFRPKDVLWGGAALTANGAAESCAKVQIHRSSRRPVVLALYGRSNRESVGSSKAVP